MSMFSFKAEVRFRDADSLARWQAIGADYWLIRRSGQ